MGLPILINYRQIGIINIPLGQCPNLDAPPKALGLEHLK